MTVYFVYRCHYGAPSEKHVRRFDHDTVLDWARAVFRQLPEDQAFDYAEKLLGGLYVFSFESMLRVDDGYSPRECPRTMKEVGQWFSDAYAQDEANGPHHVQVLTDDDEHEMAVYLFDDHYRAAKPGRADFLLLDGWELPAGDSDGEPPKMPKTSAMKPAGDGEGSLYCVGLFADDSWNLSDGLSTPDRLDGVRLPDLARYLLLHPDEDRIGYPLRMPQAALRRLVEAPAGEDAGFLAAIRDHPAERANWMAYSDWLMEGGLPPAGLHLLDRALRDPVFSGARKNRNPALDLVKVSAHAAQASKHEGRWPEDEPSTGLTPSDTFEQFIFFDDRWAAAHPSLAAGILTFASRWDVLS
jgi:uncharacterized protein (TIGR02996 family)